jgi:hypothetical protein
MDIGALIQAPMADKAWIKKCLIMGLICIIPIAGFLNLMGWMATFTTTRLEGGTDLPEAGLSYIGRGWKVFLSVLPVVGVYIVLIILTGVITAVAGHIHVRIVATILGFAMGLIMLAFGLFVGVGMPAILYLHIVKGEAYPSLQFGKIMKTITGGGTDYLMLFLAVLVAGIIGGLGEIACGVGVLVTMPFGQAIYAAAIAAFAPIAAKKNL